MELYPGSKIGIIGGGQLGRMFILECRRMNYYSVVMDPDIECPAAEVADKTVTPDNIIGFISSSNVATYEFEHLDIEIVRQIQRYIPVYPDLSILDLKRSKTSEKRFLLENGFPVPKFWTLKSGSQINEINAELPLIVKLAHGGYDGKGIFTLEDAEHLDDIRHKIKEEILVEEFVLFLREISVICARDKKGNIVCYPPAENVHDRGILLYSIAPAEITKKAQKMAFEIASDLAEKLNLIGLLCVEMFLLDEDKIVINEFAPRPHNSGHYTMDGCDISQFEMLLRAICGMPLTRPRLLCHSAMLNILGKGPDDIDLQKILSLPGVKTHFYSKRQKRERRKMGHINILGRTRKEIKERLFYIKKIIYPEDAFITRTLPYECNEAWTAANVKK